MHLLAVPKEPQYIRDDEICEKILRGEARVCLSDGRGEWECHRGENVRAKGLGPPTQIIEVFVHLADPLWPLK